MRAWRFLVLCALAAAIESSPRVSAAQEDHAASRTIGAATFMLPALADSAFVLSEFGFRQGLEYRRIPDYPVASFTRYTLQWVQFQEQVDLAIRITPWLGIYAQGLASGALGPDTPSLLFEGGGLDFGGKAGIVLRLYRNENTHSQVAARAYGGGDYGRTLDVTDFVDALAVRAAHDLAGIIQQASGLNQLQGQLQNEALSLASTNYSNIVLHPSWSTRVGASLHYAQALVGPLTMQLAAGIERAWTQQQPFNAVSQGSVTLSTTNTTVTLDAVLSASFMQWSVPLGLSAEYASVTAARSLAATNTYGATTHNVGGGVWYTGRRGVEIGALAFAQPSLKALPGFATSDSSGRPTGYQGSLVFRALW